MSLQAGLVDLPAERAARIVALSLLVDVASAVERVGAPDDPEALHDFRVALRRLRSWLRAYRPQVEGSVPGKVRRKLGAIADATGESRDLEVHIAWLNGERAALASRQRAGHSWFLNRLEARKEKADAALNAKVVAGLERVRERLESALETYHVTVHLRDPRPPRTLAAVTADLVRAHAAELRRHLEAVRTIADQEEGHEARIAGKRLRYLLEPIQEVVGGSEALVRRLKTLQDALGDMHDAHVFGAEVAAALEAAAAEQARRLAAAVLTGDADDARPALRRDPRHGLVAIARRLRERGDRAFATIVAEWLGDASDEFFHDVEAVVADLAGRTARDREIERKYLLGALPPDARAGTTLRIVQGYVPGERFAERVRRVRGDDGERWFRTVKLGTGMSKLEIEEETTREIFAALWRLTKGRRVLKTRFVVPDGELTWEIDRFDDRELVLAEVELPAVDTTVDPPAWLQPYVVREVTGESEFQNISLAK
ncbi:MAG: CHAD domain-containing protein [Gemmatimonadota bacterium]|nr:CHAD domain-containing protein [Gemmatimonadota bacterium]